MIKLGIVLLLLFTLALSIRLLGLGSNIANNRVLTPTPIPIVSTEEMPNMDMSKDLEFWLNSGGYFYKEENILRTIQGELPDNDKWRNKYFDNNPDETDGGYHPQNIFRLVTRAKYGDVSQSMYFKINRYILSRDIHRSASNGVLFFHHYQDGDNLYYAGLRVDGAAVIKKKIGGTYYTMAYKPIYLDSVYDRDSNPNLLPTNKWIGIKTEITNIDKNQVDLKLFGDLNEAGEWTLLLEAVDDGTKFGKKVITEDGYAGIRSDFMDVEFKDYLAKNL